MRYFEDVREGDEVPALTKEINPVAMMMYGAATWDYVRFHYDADYARKLGFQAPFVDGQMLGAYLAQMLSDWAGDPGAIQRLAFQNRGFVFPGDTLTCKGRVAKKESRDGQHLVECELWIENQKGERVVASASATLALPTRASV
ncbi:MAG: hypothetical protein HY686_05950 [Chloroflexi bacterium]|nr:hypothetical protein [Chloroflexota bacterium]